MIIAGASAYSRVIDFPAFRYIADQVVTPYEPLKRPSGRQAHSGPPEPARLTIGRTRRSSRHRGRARGRAAAESCCARDSAIALQQRKPGPGWRIVRQRAALAPPTAGAGPARCGGLLLRRLSREPKREADHLLAFCFASGWSSASAPPRRRSPCPSRRARRGPLGQEQRPVGQADEFGRWLRQAAHRRAGPVSRSEPRGLGEDVGRPAANGRKTGTWFAGVLFGPATRRQRRARSAGEKCELILRTAANSAEFT